MASLVPASLHAVLEDRGAPDLDTSDMLTIDGEVATTTASCAVRPHPPSCSTMVLW